MRVLYLLFTLSVVAAIAACAGGDASRATLEADRLAIDPELRIGEIDDPERSFTWFRELEIGPDGRIFTAHRQESLIRVHDTEGDPVRTIGGEGEGPGEFTGLSDMGFIGDTLWVFDSGQYRFSYFGLDGELFRMQNVPIEFGERGQVVDPSRPEGLLSDGTLWGQPPAWSREVAAGNITELPIVRMDTAGGVIDTIAVQSHRNSIWAVEHEGYGSYRRQPFNDTEIVRLSEHSPELIRVRRTAATDARPDTFRVAKITLDGDTVFSRGYGYSPPPIADAHVEELIASIGESFENRSSAFASSAPTPARAMEIARETLYRPDFYPPVSDIVLGRDGTIWLQRENLPGDSVDWSILSSDGEPVGTLTAPKGLTVLAADRWNVWGMERDELDVPYIVGYGVMRADGSDAVVSPEEVGGG